MCLIIHQPKGHTLAVAHLLDIARRNGDGFGIMYADKGTLHTFRGVLSDEDMVREYTRRAAGRECILHWRQATHGEVNEANAHPFRVGSVAVVHNGMLDVGCPVRGMSDTWHLVEHLIGPTARHEPDRLFTAEWQSVVGGMIGTGNKLVILDGAGRLAIVNRAAGVEHQGRWYSNTYAWSAPAHLQPKAFRGGYGARYGSQWWDQWEDEGTGALVAPARLVADPIVVPGVEALDADEEEAVLAIAADELTAAVERFGDIGALQWAEDHPQTAAHMLCSWYEMTAAEASDLLESDPAKAAEWLAEVAIAVA